MCADVCMRHSREGGKGEERCGNRISVSAMAARSVKHHLDRCLLSGGMFGRTQSGEANSLFITQARSASEIKAIYKLRRPWPGAHLKPNDDLFSSLVTFLTIAFGRYDWHMKTLINENFL